MTIIFKILAHIRIQGAARTESPTKPFNSPTQYSIRERCLLRRPRSVTLAVTVHILT